MTQDREITLEDAVRMLREYRETVRARSEEVAGR